MYSQTANTFFPQWSPSIFRGFYAILFFFLLIISAYFQPDIFYRSYIHSYSVIFNNDLAFFSIFRICYFNITIGRIGIICIFYKL